VPNAGAEPCRSRGTLPATPTRRARSCVALAGLTIGQSSRTTMQMQDDNCNYVDGDTAAGAASMLQLVRRPAASSDPWRTPLSGVLSLAGWHAAHRALRHTFGLTTMPDLAP
jgi:hypothetical protein